MVSYWTTKAAVFVPINKSWGAACLHALLECFVLLLLMVPVIAAPVPLVMLIEKVELTEANKSPRRRVGT